MKPILYSLLGLALLPSLRAADESSPNEARLRDALRNATLQLRAAQSETAKAQSEAIAATERAKAAEAKNAELEQRNAALAKQSNQDKTAAEKSIATLNNRLAEREQRLVDYTAVIDKWKTGYDKLATAARASEEERKRLEAEAIGLKRTLADRERKNLALFNLSNEILTRYSDFSTGRSLAAKEPFIGTARVRAETLVEGYRSRIIDNRLSAPAAPSKP